MSTIVLSLSAIAFFASSKFFPWQLPDVIVEKHNKRKLLLLVAYLTLAMGAVMDMLYYGWATGLFVAFFAFTLLLSLYVLLGPLHQRNIPAILLGTLLITIIRLFTF